MSYTKGAEGNQLCKFKISDDTALPQFTEISEFLVEQQQQQKKRFLWKESQNDRSEEGRNTHIISITSSTLPFQSYKLGVYLCFRNE